jgi:electron transport complex protein RnfG
MSPAKEFSPFRMVLTLMIICAASGALLATAQEFTKDRITAVRAANQAKAIRAVLPSTTVTMKEVKIDGIEVHKAYDIKGSLVGAAIPVSDDKAYDGLISFMVGLDAQGRLFAIQKLKLTETPGLGTKVVEKDFLGGILNKGEKDLKWTVKKDGGDVDAVAGATISSRATLRAVSSAFPIFEKIRQQD